MISVVKAEELENGVRVRIRQDGEIKYITKDFKNYFYIQEIDFEMNKSLIVRYCDQYQEVVDHNRNLFIKIFLKNNFWRNKLRRELEELGVTTYEADITANKRFFLEYKGSYNHKFLEYAFYDIETYDMLGFDKDFKGNIKASFPILSIAIKSFKKDKDGKEYYFRNTGLDDKKFDPYRELVKEYLDNQYLREISDEELSLMYKEDNKDKIKILEEKLLVINKRMKELQEEINKWSNEVIHNLTIGEKKLLKDFYEVAKTFDVLSGWNSNGFDDIFVRDRGKLHGVFFDDLLHVNLDYMLMYKGNNFDPVKSFKLNDIAYKELKKLVDSNSNELKNIDEVKKVDWKKLTKARKYFHLFLIYPEIHKEYNLQDVRILDMLEKELNFFDLHAMQTDLTRCTLNDTLYNSRMCDNDLLKSFREKNILVVSKPSQEEKELREQDKNSGGYTFCFLPGLHPNVKCFDFKAHYLNVIRSFNISSENFIREVMPDLTKVFTNEEIDYIKWAENEATKHLGSDGKLKPSYDKAVESKAKELGLRSMEDLMWHFIKNYDQKIEHRDDESYTPSEINRNTFGWKVQPHRIFSKTERGILPKILDEVSDKRDMLKKEMKKYEKGSLKYRDYNIKQLAVKKIGNSHYGNFLYRGSRYYRQEVGNAITTTARYITKLCMLEIWNNGMKITHGDSITGDSKIILEDEEKNIETLWELNTNKIIKRGSKEIKLWNNKKVLTCDNNFKNVFAQPIEIIRHKVNKSIYRIKLSSGDMIDVTEDHSLIGLDENFIELKPNQINKVLFNAKVPIIGKDNKLPKQLYNFLGMLIANGTTDRIRNSIYLSYNYMNEYVKDIIKPLSIMYNFSVPKIKKNGFDIQIVSKSFRNFIDDLGFVGNSKSKRVPKWLFEETEENIIHFLSGYMSGDGTIFGDGKKYYGVKCSSVSFELMKDIKRLFELCGIAVSFRDARYKNTYNGKDTKTTMKELVIINKKDYADKFYFIGKEKQKRMKYLTGKKNKDFVERKIINIRKLNMKPVYVYDLSIPKYEKFYANGFLVHNTDSSYCVGNKSIDEMDLMFKKMLDIKLDVFNLIGVGDKKHSVQFDFEKEYKYIIPIKKKRYYYMEMDGTIGGKGGSQTRSDVLKLGKDLQRELLSDIFNNKFDKEYWKNKLLKLKDKVFNGELEEDHLIKVQGLAKDVDEYGKPMIDKKTGLQKMTKDGKPRFANIPAHVKMAKEMIENGEFVNVGDKIPYIVFKNKPIVPITVKKYRLTKQYDRKYYHEAIVKPVLEILLAVYPNLVYSYFKECWFYTDKQLKKLQEDMISGDEE